MPSSKTGHRVQFAVAILGTVGAIYGISRLIKPSSAKSAEVPVVETQTTPIAHVDPPPIKPSIGSAFVDAVREGDLARMEKHWVKDMPVSGTLALGAATGKVQVVEWLLAHGADVHENEASVEAPVLTADAYPDVVKLLLSKGAMEPTLEMAAGACAPNAVTRRLAAGDSPKASAGDGSSLLASVIDSAAALDKRQLVLEKLLAAGADPNAHDGSYPLASALSLFDGDETSQHAAKKMVETLLAKGARVDIDALQAAIGISEDGPRNTALDAILNAKLEADAIPRACFSLTGERDVPVLKKLAAKGINWAFNDGEEQIMPLLDALERMDAPIAKAMLDAGAPATQRARDGRSALGIALDRAASEDGARMVEILLAKGASATKRLHDGRTPLYAAAEAGDVRAVNALLAHGAKPNEIVLDETALDVAEANGHTAVARVLHAHGGRRAPQRD